MIGERVSVSGSGQLVRVWISRQTLDELAISDAEYEAIVERLGREPNHLELGLFGSLWSEHCGYKHSKPLLFSFVGVKGMFDTDSDRLLVAPGSENAGVVDIGEGWAVVMKIESHNHPSAIEPYQGARRSNRCRRDRQRHIRDGREAYRASQLSEIRPADRARKSAAVRGRRVGHLRIWKLMASVSRTWEGRCTSLPATPAIR